MRTPPIGTKLRNKGLAQGLSVFIRGTSEGLVEEVTGLRVPYNAGQNLVPGEYGHHVYNDGTSAALAFDYTRLVENWTDEVTVCGIFRLDGVSSVNRTLVQSAGGGDDFLSSWAIDAGDDMGGRIGTGAANIRTEQDITNRLDVWEFCSLQRTTGKGQWASNHEDGAGALNTTNTGVPNKMAHNLTVFTSLDEWEFAAFAIWGRELSYAELASFYQNPWQVFKPQRILIPMTAAAVVEEFGPETTVFITDVNTTESWTDGDTALPITGSGFL